MAKNYIPEEFFMCDHGCHFSDCPLCSQFPEEIVKAIDEYFGDTISDEDAVILAKWLVGHI